MTRFHAYYINNTAREMEIYVMMRKLLMAAGLACTALAMGGCAFITSEDEEKGAVAGTPAGESGDSARRSYAVSGFTGVVASGSDDVAIVKGAAFAVTATGDPEELSKSPTLPRVAVPLLETAYPATSIEYGVEM